jgi:uncharacterized protein (TIGR00288 family)
MQNDEKSIAVFIDFENVAMGVRESKYGNFDIDLVLKRLVEKGKILVKRAYSDWHRYSDFKRAFHQAAIELIDVPQTRYSGKNSADIRMVVDAMDMAYQKEHIDTFVIVSGDSDFSPLVSKLRENGRYVIGIGVKQSSSDLLINNCDEFIFYEDLVRPTAAIPVVDPQLHQLSPKKTEAIRLVLESFQALQREGKEVIYGSMIKQTLIRKLPSFNETYFGYPTFSRLLEDAAENQLLKLLKDQRSGGYIVTLPIEVANREAAMTSAAAENGQAAETAAAATSGSAAPITAQQEHRDRLRRSRWERGRRTSFRPPGTLRSVPATAPPLSGTSTEPQAPVTGDEAAILHGAPNVSQASTEPTPASDAASSEQPASIPVESEAHAAVLPSGSEDIAAVKVTFEPKATTQRVPRPRYRRNSLANRSIKPSPLKAGGPKKGGSAESPGVVEPTKPEELNTPAISSNETNAAPQPSGSLASSAVSDSQKNTPKAGSGTTRRPPSRGRRPRPKIS